MKNKKGEKITVTNLEEAQNQTKKYGKRYKSEIKRDKVLYDGLTKKGFIQTDPSCNQYYKEINHTTFLFREDRIINPETKETKLYESEINLSDYTKEQMFYFVEIFGYSFNEMCNWIDENINLALIAECIFEQEV